MKIAFLITIIATTVVAVTGQGNPPDDTGDAAGLAQAWANACLIGLQTSGFRFLDTSKYDQWFNETSVMQIAQTGTFIGPEEITEYVNFVEAPFFDYFIQAGEFQPFPISLTQDECVLLAVGVNKMQVNADMGEPACIETTTAFRLHFTVSDLEGNGFIIHRTNVFFSGIFIHDLFVNALNSDGIRDYICDDVLMAGCPETVAFNDLTAESCKERYDELPLTNAAGYLDDYTKGCRIMHSAFAQINDKHCPHLSFLPEADFKSRTKCQESYGVVPEDLFTDDELTLITNFAIQSGHDATTLYKECEYESPDAGISMTTPAPAVGTTTNAPSPSPVEDDATTTEAPSDDASAAAIAGNPMTTSIVVAFASLAIFFSNV